MGSRVISEVSNIMLGEFMKNFQAQLQQPADPSEVAAANAEAKPIKATSVAWQAAKGVFRKDS
jgi:chemotaxis protein CheY-P-specific phosphatase CheC